MKSEDLKYRFPGLNSFSEDDKEIFKGRQKESENLYATISLYKTVVLHADSGTGKSSLIQAGLLPLLKESEENYFPVILQFNEIAQGDSVNLLTDFTLKKIENNIKDRKIETAPIALLDVQPSSLWKYSKILEKAEKKLLLIFDQFENLQTFKPKQVDHFIDELYNLVNPKIPSDIFKTIEIELSSLVDEKSDAFNQVNQSYLFLSKPSIANLLFVIREDKLGVMSLLSDYFPDILKNDFRIEPLSIDYAREALEIPAGYKEKEFKSDPFSFEDPDYVINKIADEDTGLVDPILLQIVASSIEKNQVILKEKIIIANQDIPEVLNIVIEYYNNLLDEIKKDLKLTELQISEYKKNILTKFVINERRTLVDSESIDTNHIKFIKALVEKGLIREIPAEKKATYFQLVHDRMIVPIINDPKIIKGKYFEKYLKSIRFANKVAIISIVPLLLSCIYIESSYFYNSSHLQKLKSDINNLDSKLSSSKNEFKKLSDSISVIDDSLYVMKPRLLEGSTKLDSVVNYYKRLQEHQKNKSDSITKLNINYFKNIGEKDFLERSSKSLITTIVFIVNILFWGLLLFFQFARRKSLKYLFKEIHIYKNRQISNYKKIQLLLPLWLGPVSKKKYLSLSPVKPVSIFNNTYRPSFSNFISVLCLLIIVVIQFHLTYLSYALRNKNLDLIFYLNLLFLLFSIIVATIWFTPLNNSEYNNEKESSKLLSRKDFITISIYTVLVIALFKKISILSESKKPKYTGIKNPRYRVKKLKPQFNLPDYKSQVVLNKKSNIIHYIDGNGFSLTLKSIQSDKDFILFRNNIQKFNQLDKLAIKGKPRISIKDLSWNAENIALDCLKSGNIEMAAKILLYGIKQNYKSSLRLTDLLVLICIRHNTKVPKDALDQLINYTALSKDKKLIERVEKWKNQNWRNKILNRPKVVFNKTEI